MTQCALTVVRDGEPKWRLRLNAQVTVVGRDPKLAGCLNDPGVSRRHAVFVLSPSGALIVHDLGSRNGLFLNGRKVPPGAQVRVARGDRILAGNTLLLVDAVQSPSASGSDVQQELCLDDVLDVESKPAAPKRKRGRRSRLASSKRNRWRRSLR